MSTLHHIPLPPIRTTTEHSRPTRISLSNGQANDDLIPESEWSQVFHYGDHEPRTVEQTESCYNNDHSHSDKRGWLVGDGWLEMKVNHTFPCLHEMWFHSTNGHYTLLIRSKTIDRWRLTKQLHPHGRTEPLQYISTRGEVGRINHRTSQDRIPLPLLLLSAPFTHQAKMVTIARQGDRDARPLACLLTGCWVLKTSCGLSQRKP